MLARLRSADDRDENVIVALSGCNDASRLHCGERFIGGFTRERFTIPSGPAVPREYFLGCVALARGEGAAANVLFETARRVDADAVPDNAARQTAAGSIDPLLGPLFEAALASIYAWSGEQEEPLKLLE
jgi:hypothetical protein